ncbi:MAG: hypothetical protein HYU27_01190 [Acidobacteria bacterium]|nr:hypothetical protein [Acidobacteriota bacterium]
MKLPVIAVSVFLLTQQSQPPPPKVTIEGVVVRIGTGEPIEGAQVGAVRQNPGAAGALSGGVSPAPPPAPLPPPLPPAFPAGAGGTFAGTTTFSFSSGAGTPLNVPGAVPPMTTDGSGKFAIKDLDPGAYRIAIAAFTFRGVPPGDYKVFSWEALESYAFYDPAVLQQFEPKGKPVRVSESSKESVEARIIPAEGPQ